MSSVRSRVWLAMVVATIPIPALAADWWLVSSSGSGDNEIAVFVDIESAIIDGSSDRQVWVYYIYEKLADSGERKAKALQKFDCSRRTMTLISRISIGNNNRIIRSTSWKSYEQSASHVVPDSVGEGLWKFVCKGGDGDEVHITTGSPDEFAARFFKY